jgi:hypothetical protein
MQAEITETRKSGDSGIYHEGTKKEQQIIAEARKSGNTERGPFCTMPWGSFRASVLPRFRDWFGAKKKRRPGWGGVEDER